MEGRRAFDELAEQPEVLHVWEDEVRPLATHYSAGFLGLFDAEDGLRGPEGLDGEGIVVGVIDSGITPGHPALSDTRAADRPRLCRSSWAESSLLGRWLCRRFDLEEGTLVFEPPEDWNGICQEGPEFAADSCNNKLIGARYFFDGAETTGLFDDGEIFSARDVDGHGTHTATTAAGNRVQASIFGTFLGNVEGIAPRARIAAYKACWLRPGDMRASCNTSDLANAIDAAVADGVHVINYSVGSSILTTTAPDDIALMAAAKAGILTVVAGGNEGPDLGTIGSPSGAPWVITTAASSRDGEHSLEAAEVTAPAAVAGRYAVREASFTPPLDEQDPIEARLVLVDDADETLADGSVSVVAGTGSSGFAADGSVAWDQVTVDPSQPYSITGAPRVAKGLVFIGNGGAEYGVRGYVSAYDAETGQLRWRFYTVPGDPSKGPEGAASDQPLAELAAKTWNGEWWKEGGGGTIWDSMAYDPELDIRPCETGSRESRGSASSSWKTRPSVVTPWVSRVSRASVSKSRPAEPRGPRPARGPPRGPHAAPDAVRRRIVPHEAAGRLGNDGAYGQGIEHLS